MGTLFKNNTETQNISERQILQNKYNSSRHNLLLIVVFTVVNVILLVTNSNSYFLFSAFIPYFFADIGMYMCGLYPEEYYAWEATEMEFVDSSFLVVMLVLAAIFVVMYLLSWIFSNKNRVGWLIFALVFFSIDTLGMFALMGFSVDSIIDILFHAWVIFSLISGIVSYNKLKKLPVEEMAETVEASADAEPAQVAEVVLNGEKVEENELN